MIFIYSKKTHISEYNVRLSKKCGVLSDLIVSVRQVSFIVNPYLIYYENSLHQQSNTSVHLFICYVIGTLKHLSGLVAPHHYLLLQCHVAVLRHADTCRSGMSMYESWKRRLSEGSRRFTITDETPTRGKWVG